MSSYEVPVSPDDEIAENWRKAQGQQSTAVAERKRRKRRKQVRGKKNGKKPEDSPRQLTDKPRLVRRPALLINGGPGN